MTVAAVLVALLGVALVIAGLVVAVRLGRSGADVARVEVQGVKVRQVGLSRPPKLEFDYPGPDGRTLRAQSYAPMSAHGVAVAATRRGEPLRVFVDPANPDDAVLAPGRTGRNAPLFIGVVLMVLGVAALGSAALLATVAGLGAS